MPRQGRENRTLKIQNWRSDAKTCTNDLEKIGEIKVTDQAEADRKVKHYMGRAMVSVREELMRNGVDRVERHNRRGSLSDPKTWNMRGEN